MPVLVAYRPKGTVQEDSALALAGPVQSEAA